jgi:transcription initiation factor TFIID subunit 15
LNNGGQGGDAGQNNGGQGGNNGQNNGGQGANNNNNQGGGGGGQGGAAAAAALGGIAAPEIGDSGNGDRPFSVNGNTFVNKEAAVQRACDIQNNSCRDGVNLGQIQGVTADQCGAQVQQCVAELS